MLRAGSFCFLAILLTACGQGADPTAPEPPPTEASTWAEWVERERPRRPVQYDHHYHNRRGLPNMRRWRPEDFLTREELDEPHAELCELPQDQRLEVWSLVRDSNNILASFEEKLAYAERGYAEAQAGMGWYCYQHTNAAVLEPGQLSLDEAYAWSRRAAASGDPRAMYRHSECMRFMAQDRQSGRAEHALDPFWMDQIHYWLWRAATEGLYGRALVDLRPTRGINGDSYPTWEESALYTYKWSRIWELQAIFRRVPYYLGPQYMETQGELAGQRQALSEEELQQAEAMVGEWLREHLHVWDAIYHRPNSPGGSHVHCPGEPGHLQGFDYESLNRELAQYGLRVELPGK
ncbi:MAG: hypothetical protein LAT50_20280 [Ectothiorhodospiraceae bacterium]|nr:hypothetical protein [Ectothiorhodospiraceae bacterium]